jgi:hypothetical protein
MHTTRHSKRSRHLLWIAWAGLLAASAQAVGGVMAGRWFPVDHDSETVTVSFNSERKGQGLIHITLGRDGERFKGSYLRIDEDAPQKDLSRIHSTWTSRSFDHFEAGPYGDEWLSSEIRIPAFRRRYSGEVVASLTGDRGGAIRCRFSLERPDLGLPGGATGRCQVTDGSTIEIGRSNDKTHSKQ